MQRQVRHLVEKQRPAFRALDESFLIGHRAGEAAALVPEELTFHELRRDGAAVDGDERPFAPRAALVNHARDEFLAGARLPADVHRRLAARDARDHLSHLLHDRGTAEQTRTPQRRSGFLDGGAEPDGAAHELAQYAQVQGLGNEIECAELQRAHGCLDVAMRRDHRHRQSGAVLLDPAHELEPIPVRQAHVRETQVEALGFQKLARAGEVGRRAGLHVHAAQSEADELEQVRFVVDDQHHRLIGGVAHACEFLVHHTSQRRGSANTSLNTLPPSARGW